MLLSHLFREQKAFHKSKLNRINFREEKFWFIFAHKDESSFTSHAFPTKTLNFEIFYHNGEMEERWECSSKRKLKILYTCDVEMGKKLKIFSRYAFGYSVFLSLCFSDVSFHFRLLCSPINLEEFAIRKALVGPVCIAQIKPLEEAFEARCIKYIFRPFSLLFFPLSFPRRLRNRDLKVFRLPYHIHHVWCNLIWNCGKYTHSRVSSMNILLGRREGKREKDTLELNFFISKRGKYFMTLYAEFVILDKALLVTCWIFRDIVQGHPKRLMKRIRK